MFIRCAFLIRTPYKRPFLRDVSHILNNWITAGHTCGLRVANCILDYLAVRTDNRA